MTTPQEPYNRWLRAFPRGVPEVLVLPGRIGSGDIARLCATLRLLADRAKPSVVICDAGGLTDPDAACVDALARLQLTARRCGTSITVAHPPQELDDLLAFAGLHSVLQTCASSALESLGQPEQRKETGRVEEEADPADPPP